MAGPGWGLPRLDGFILTERLGSGTYATVYKAYAKVGVGGPCPRCPGAEHLAPVPASPEQVRLGDWPAGAGERRPPDAWQVEEELAAPLRFKNKHTPVCSGRAGEDLREPRCQWLRNRLCTEVALGAGRSLRPDSREAGPVSRQSGQF